MDQLVTPALAAYLARGMGQGFDWREPCALWAAGAVRAVTGYDPAADLRGRALSSNDWTNMIKAGGGLLAVVAPRMAHPALRPVPAFGLCEGVAVARLDGRRLCGVVVRGRLAVLGQTGLRFADDFETLGAWTWSQPLG